jgi:uncharacterized membrane protein
MNSYLGALRSTFMKNLHLLLTILLVLASLGTTVTAIAQSDDTATVQAVLFYSPTCPHCHYVISEVLMPMLDEYGERLQIIGIDTTEPGGAQLYQATIEHYRIPHARQGVPTLVVNDVVLVGSEEIPKQFPVIVMTGLAGGGLTWPDIPGLDQVLPADADRAGPASGQAAVTVAPNKPNLAAAASDAAALSAEVDDPIADPAGFALAGLVLTGMVVAFGYAAWRVGKVWPRVRRLNRNFTVQARTWTVPLLALAGLGVAAYLVYVEISQVEAVCGPIGQCNAVQASPYARIFWLPVAGLGLLNYLAIGLLWLGQRYDLDKIADLSGWGLLGLTVFGTLFSIYLTLLELFVIRAVCLWCLSSAIITALLMVLVVASLTNDIKPNKLARSH